MHLLSGIVHKNPNAFVFLNKNCNFINRVILTIVTIEEFNLLHFYECNGVQLTYRDHISGSQIPMKM